MLLRIYGPHASPKGGRGNDVRLCGLRGAKYRPILPGYRPLSSKVDSSSRNIYSKACFGSTKSEKGRRLGARNSGGKKKAGR